MPFKRIVLDNSTRLALQVFFEVQEQFNGVYEGSVRDCQIDDCRVHDTITTSDTASGLDESRRSVDFFVQPYLPEVRKLIVTVVVENGYGDNEGKWVGYSWHCVGVYVTKINQDGTSHNYNIEPPEFATA